MHISEIKLERSGVIPSNYVLQITSGDRRVTFSFEPTLFSFAEAVSEAVKFFGLAQGLIAANKDGSFRSLKKL